MSTVSLFRRVFATELAFNTFCFVKIELFQLLISVLSLFVCLLFLLVYWGRDMGYLVTMHIVSLYLIHDDRRVII